MKLVEKKYPYMKESVFYGKVDNGLTVILLPKVDFHETYGILTTNFGGIHTRFTLANGNSVVYPAGIAHFLEHKLFETENEEDIMNEFAKLGASANAYTSFRQTSYLFSTTQKVLESLSLLQSFVREPYFTEDNVEREQGIIEQEIEMYQDDADYRLFTGILSSLYPESPLAYDIAGTVESIAAITADDLHENFDVFYHPSNMNLFVIGNFDLEAVWKQISSYQVAQMDNPAQSFELAGIQKLPIQEHLSEQFEVSTPKLAVGLRGNDEVDKETIQKYRLSLQFLFAMLFGWTSKRYQQLYEQGKIDSSFQFQLEVTPEYHYLIISGDTQEPITLSSILMKALRKFEDDADVTEDHLQLLKNEMYGDFIRSLNSLEFTASHFVSQYSEYENVFDIPQMIQSFQLDDIREAGRRFIDHCDMTDFTIFPK
ncbi:EF-P 5-aminopentanol modification-associated protein YfmH [Streptococcus suis]|uniref:EF-P 5-aminopentanol modification-associated protein YfmH n=1 Tax=Streptococcus suis TaxID=1307 RepID=UPI001EE89E6C|nr:pitrilysin family protein [Streptococcus suis]MBS8048228.1 insulinase family protein [Streptococcus suis]